MIFYFEKNKIIYKKVKGVTAFLLIDVLILCQRKGGVAVFKQIYYRILKRKIRVMQEAPQYQILSFVPYFWQ